MKSKKDNGYVTIRLFKAKDERYNHPEMVGHNGVVYSVPRGVDVKVPKGVAEILRNAEKQNGVASELIESLVAESK